MLCYKTIIRMYKPAIITIDSSIEMKTFSMKFSNKSENVHTKFNLFVFFTFLFIYVHLGLFMAVGILLVCNTSLIQKNEIMLLSGYLSQRAIYLFWKNITADGRVNVDEK